MRIATFFTPIIALTLFSATHARADVEPTTHIYKTVEDSPLELDVYAPADHTSAKPKPAVVFFFGGGWRGGTRVQFVPQSQYLALRGMIGITVTYRTKNSHGTSPYECVKDARSAVRWVRKNSAKLGIDPDRIAVSGGSAGGHLALTTTLINAYDEPDEDASISCKGNAMILFNPVSDTNMTRLGDKGKTISPQHHITKNLPPAIAFHGTDDTTVRFASAERFENAMTAAGNDFTLYAYEGQGHGFFNLGRGNDDNYYNTVAEMDAFLVRLGYLEPIQTK